MQPMDKPPCMQSRRQVLQLRAAVYRQIRDYFAARDVLEVETPMLSAAGNTEPNIESFRCQFNGPSAHRQGVRWLRTSPEFALKRLLAQGVGDCFELGRVFRDGEAGRRHNPEFTMLEWYRVGWDEQRLITETLDLLTTVLEAFSRPVAVRRCTYRELFLQALGIDPFTADIDALRAPLANVRIDGHGLGRDDWLDLLLTHRLQPGFAHDCITVVCDFPSSQAALARIRPGDPPVAERFELYLGHNELANGYHELTDAVEQRARFERDQARRQARGQPFIAIDEPLLAALPSMPACAGVALGIERLLMWLANTDDIADVLAFAFAEA